MSYEIIYDKQFVKVKEDLYLPMVLAGSNNCFEMGRGTRDRRARSWFHWNFNGYPFTTKQVMLDDAYAMRERQIAYSKNREGDDTYDDKSFGSWAGITVGSRSATFGQYLGVFNTGCAKALTVEQLAEEGVILRIGTPWVYGGEFEEKTGLRPLFKTAKTGQDAIDIYEEIVEYLKDTEFKNPSIQFQGMGDRMPKWIRRKYFPRVKRERTEMMVKEFWTVGMFYPDDIERGSNEPRYYFKKFTARSCYHSGYPYHTFLTEKEAIAKCKRSNRRGRGFPFKLEPWKVVAKNEIRIVV